MNTSPASGQPAPRTEGDSPRCVRPTPAAMSSAASSTCRRSTTASTWSASSTCTTRTRASRCASACSTAWVTATTWSSGSPTPCPARPRPARRLDALAVMDQWMTNMRANPGRTIAREQARRRRSTPASTCRASSSTPATTPGTASSTTSPPGTCTQALPAVRHLTHRRRRAHRRRHLQLRAQGGRPALADGTYGRWTPSAAEIAQLKQIFPSGVCDYSKPDQARP